MGIFKRNKQKKNDRLRGEPQNQRVISYYTATRQQLDSFERRSAQSDSLAYSRLERLRSNWFTIGALVALACVFVYLASLSATPHISIEGTMYRTPAEYQAVVQKAFGNDVRNRVKPLLQQASLEKSIAEAVPEATSVTVTSTLLGHRPEVELTIDPALATFTQNNGTSLIMSQRGRLLLAAGEASKNATNLPIIQNLTGVEGKAGEQFMRPDEALAYTRLLGQYKADGSTPIATLTTIPHEITIKETGRGYSVRYLLDTTITSQYGSLRAVENTLKSSNQSPAEYIDVRLADKVYFK